MTPFFEGEIGFLFRVRYVPCNKSDPGPGLHIFVTSCKTGTPQRTDTSPTKRVPSAGKASTQKCRLGWDM